MIIVSVPGCNREGSLRVRPVMAPVVAADSGSTQDAGTGAAAGAVLALDQVAVAVPTQLGGQELRGFLEIGPGPGGVVVRPVGGPSGGEGPMGGIHSGAWMSLWAVVWTRHGRVTAGCAGCAGVAARSVPLIG
nr:hypothetical protein KPHV_28650 [Kitasatospora purpeofusca]